MTYNERSWLDAATGPIRFRPDRAAVRAELEAHIEDKTADLRRIFPDMGEGEVRERALSQMGDPEALGRELAAIHKPWLGYLWRVSQAALFLVGLLALLVLCRPGGAFGFLGGNDDSIRGDIYYTNTKGWQAPAPVRLGDYTLAVVNSGRSEEELYRQQEGERVLVAGPRQCAHLRLRITGRWPWQRPPERLTVLEERLQVTDDRGRHYGLAWIPGKDGVYGALYEQAVRSERTGPNWREYELKLVNISPDTRWVQLDYQMAGQSFSIRVDIPGDISLYNSTVVDEESADLIIWEEWE